MNEQTESIMRIARTLPQHTLTTTLRNRNGYTTRRFTGARLVDYARTVGLRPRPPSIGFGNYYFMVTASDGFIVSVAYFEVAPRTTDKQVILACEQDGELIPQGVRLVVPGDHLGGRSISGVAGISLHSVPSVEPQATRPRSDTLTIGGLVSNPKSYRLDDLARFAMHEVHTPVTTGHGASPVVPRRYAGVLLWDLLNDVVPVVDSNINEDILRKVVVARGTDGYASVIASGEIDPRFMGGQALVATTCEGRRLTDTDGQFRLVIPYDKAVGRGLKCLHAIEVRDP